MDFPVDVIPQLKKQLFSALTSKVDALHVLSVISDGDAATPDEAKYLKHVSRLLSVPLGGDLVWHKCLEVLGDDPARRALALSYLNSGLKVASLEPAQSLETAKTSVVNLIDHILNREPVLELAAMCQCPQCGFIYGEIT